MEALLDILSTHPLFRNITEDLAFTPKRVWLSGLWGSSRSLFVAYLRQQLNLPLLIITPGMEEGEVFSQDLSYFLKEEVPFFPVWEFSPEAISPASEILAERLAFFEKMVSDKCPPILVLPIEAALEKWPALEKISVSFLKLNQGEKIELEDFLLRLVDMGYARVDMVQERGEFSRRGEIVDIFSPTFSSPLRLVLEFDKISSLRFFSIATQRSLDKIQAITIAPAKEIFSRQADISQTGNCFDYFKKEYLFIFEEPARSLKRGVTGSVATNLLEEGRRGTVFLTSFEETIPPMEGLKPYKIKTRSAEPWRGKVNEVIKEIKKWQEEDYHIFIACNNKGEEKRFKEILRENRLNLKGIRTILGRFKEGFILPELKLTFLTDEEIFNRYEKKLVQRFKGGAPYTSLFELNEGDYVVHLNHGIGRYLGLRHMKVGGEESDYLAIEYRDGAKLYVPVEGLDLVQKYIGLEARPPALSQLGGKGWSRVKERTRANIKDMAAELLKLQAQRQVFKGHAFSPDSDWQSEFEEAFIYEETSDQKKAIREVKMDMESTYPMDRLICGDVGYGKTEVAIRASFKAVMNNKQVACLAPTTLLAEQHYDTFRERMADYPITIACLSRFATRAAQKEITEKLSRGEIDIVIGTHRLLQKDIHFKALGLIIIDEEQRFGVAHKEKIRHLQSLVDCITLSATPIPRTLYMGLAGLREMSLINTPPEDRLPIETFIINFDRDFLKKAILQEMGRGGQTFVVHNRIETIYSFTDIIREIVPEARLAIAHGRMSSSELEEGMVKFLKKELDVLVATTIIASGLDIPNANTIIIDEAHTFGLADLYQLRGRVGRFKHRAYAFFIVPKFRTLTTEARKRLKAIEDFTELGSGFKLALRDLEIRGAGNLLGPEQHGFIAAIGFDLYCQLLQKIVAQLKGEKVEEKERLNFEVGVDLSLPADYIPGVKQRLDIYRRLAGLKDKEDMRTFEEELVDRFGELPERAREVLEALEVKAMASHLGLVYLGLRGRKLLLKFSPACKLEPQNLNKINENLRKRLVFAEESTLFIKLRPQDKDIIPLIRDIIRDLEFSHLITRTG